MTGDNPYKKEFLQGAIDESTKKLQSIAGAKSHDQAFSGGVTGGMGAQGGVQGASRLNDNPEIRRAVTSKRARTRDYRLARRQALKRGDRLGAARIGGMAANQGFNLHGIGRAGDDQKAAAGQMQGALSSALDTAQQNMNQLTGVQSQVGTSISSGDMLRANYTSPSTGGDPYGVNPYLNTGGSTSQPPSGSSQDEVSPEEVAEGSRVTRSEVDDPIAVASEPLSTSNNPIAGFTMGDAMRKSGLSNTAFINRENRANSTVSRPDLPSLNMLPQAPAGGATPLPASTIKAPIGGDVNPSAPLSRERLDDVTFSPDFAHEAASKAKPHPLKGSDQQVKLMDIVRGVAGVGKAAAEGYGDFVQSAGTALGESLPQPSAEEMSAQKELSKGVMEKIANIAGLVKSGASPEAIKKAEAELADYRKNFKPTPVSETGKREAAFRTGPAKPTYSRPTDPAANLELSITEQEMAVKELNKPRSFKDKAKAKAHKDAVKKKYDAIRDSKERLKELKQKRK